MYTDIAINLSHIHPKQYHIIKKNTQKPEDILQQDDQFYSNNNIPQAVANRLQSPNDAKIQKIIRWVNQKKIHIINESDSRYPKYLKQCPCHPPMIYLMGQPTALQSPSISIVGSRNASTYGLRVTRQLTAALAKQGFVIASGLAIGIDHTAHQACLDAQQQTIAVIGLGLDNITPQQNRQLAESITRQGCIISEMPPETPYQKHCFPRRNRIISALSVATLIPEATLASGTLSTAQYTIDLNRDLLVVPGRIDQPQASGCHWLIQQGAHLVTSPEDCKHILCS